jgi:GNAT superfamily N-acetyltransferase
LRAEYRIITDAEFDLLWDRNIAADPQELMWPVWRQRFRERIDKDQAITFGVILDGDPVGEGTLELDTGKDPRLCDGKTTAYLSALRIRKEFEGMGHISRLVKTMEEQVRSLGYNTLTIGVEESEVRNRAIYRYGGYVNHIMTETKDGETVLYFAKEL